MPAPEDVSMGEAEGAAQEHPSTSTSDVPQLATVTATATAPSTDNPSPNPSLPAQTTIPQALPPSTSTPAPTTAMPPNNRSNTPHNATSLPPSAIIPPANAHGSHTRVYLNSKVTPVLLEGMKYLAANEPEKPLEWLGEFLIRKAREVETKENGL